MDRPGVPAPVAVSDARLRSPARRRIAAALGLGLAAAGAAAADGPCTFLKPADLAGSPARWLGDCFQGKAEGVGVVRVGAKEPYEFFLGEMKAGAPVRGLLVFAAGGWAPTSRFDAAGRNATSRSSEKGEIDAVFDLAIRAANATAIGFQRAGNGASADYYSKLAKKVTDGAPD